LALPNLKFLKHKPTKRLGIGVREDPARSEKTDAGG